MNTHNIEWHDAVREHQQIREKISQEQADAYQEFIESDCELFDENDLLYYREKTGCDLGHLVLNGRNMPETLMCKVINGLLT